MKTWKRLYSPTLEFRYKLIEQVRAKACGVRWELDGLKQRRLGLRGLELKDTKRLKKLVNDLNKRTIQYLNAYEQERWNETLTN